MVPNHGVIVLAMAYGGDDFQRALMIANTGGWDTDCNSGNVGCLMGIKVGLAGIDTSPVDWRGPVADRMYLPTADGGRADHRRGPGDASASAASGARWPASRRRPGTPPSASASSCRVRCRASTPRPTASTLENTPKHSARGQRSLAVTIPSPCPTTRGRAA